MSADWRARRSSTPRRRCRDRRRPGADRASPVSALFEPSAVLSSMKASVSVQDQLRAGGEGGDLPARELDRAVAGESNVAAQDARRAESRAARGHVEERLVGAGAGEIDRARIIERRRRHLVRRRERGVADGERAAVGQRPRQGQARSAVAAAGVETDGSVIDERAGRRHRGPVVERRTIAPAPIEASPVRALFDPGAVLSSMKASFPFRRNCALAARLVISPLANSIALSPASRTWPLKTPAVPNPALPATSRSAWLALEPVQMDPARIIERRRRHLVRRRERGVADARDSRCWSASPRC